MKKKLTISLIALFLILGVIFAIGALASESEDNPRDMINKFEAAVKEVLGDDGTEVGISLERFFLM